MQESDLVTLTELAYRVYKTSLQMKKLMLRGVVTPRHKEGTAYIFDFKKAFSQLVANDGSIKCRPMHEWNYTKAAKAATKAGQTRHSFGPVEYKVNLKSPPKPVDIVDPVEHMDPIPSVQQGAAQPIPPIEIDTDVSFQELLKQCNADMSSDQAKRIREIVKAKREVLELMKEDGEYVHVQEFIQQLTEAATILQKGIRAIVPRNASLLAATTDQFKIRKILESEIEHVLGNFKNYMQNIGNINEVTESESTDAE